MTKPLLNVSTLDPDRPIIAIDGNPYECAVREDFGAIEIVRMERLIARVQAIRAPTAEETDEEADERAVVAETAARKVVAIVLPKLLPETLDKLKLGQLLAIMQAYQSFMTAAGQQEENQPAPLPSRTGARSSRVSKDSTVATPSAG